MYDLATKLPARLRSNIQEIRLLWFLSHKGCTPKLRPLCSEFVKRGQAVIAQSLIIDHNTRLKPYPMITPELIFYKC